MKLDLFVILSFLLFAFTTNLSLAYPQVGPDQVKDISGKPIFPGSKLYIMPSPFTKRVGGGGGVKATITGNSTCPVTVVQDFSKAEKGLKVRFSPPGITPGLIFTGTILDFYFVEKPGECVSSPKWVVVGDDFPGGKWIGVGDSPQDHPGKQLITGNGNFNIQKGDYYGYYIVFCRNFRATSTCFNLTRYDDKTGSRMVLTKGQPYQVIFVDATLPS